MNREIEDRAEARSRGGAPESGRWAAAGGDGPIGPLARILAGPFMALALMVALASPAAAQGQVPPGTFVVAAENVTALAEAEAGRPRSDDGIRLGDRVRYTLTFTNPTAGPVRNVVLHNPLAEGLRFVAGSARIEGGSALVEYSIDGGASFSSTPMIEVVEGGRRVERAAPAQLYTDVRWTISTEIEAGARVIASYEARLAAEVPAPEGSDR